MPEHLVQKMMSAKWGGLRPLSQLQVGDPLSQQSSPHVSSFPVTGKAPALQLILLLSPKQGPNNVDSFTMTLVVKVARCVKTGLQ